MGALSRILIPLMDFYMDILSSAHTMSHAIYCPSVDFTKPYFTLLLCGLSCFDLGQFITLFALVSHFRICLPVVLISGF